MESLRATFKSHKPITIEMGTVTLETVTALPQSLMAYQSKYAD